MVRRITLTACWLLAFIATPLQAAPPSQVQAQYDIFKSGIKVADMSETYTRSDDHYRIESVTKAHGLFALFKPETITVISEGIVTAQGLQPLSFDYKRKLDTDKNAHADFDWQAAKLTLADQAGKRSVALPAGTQDRLSAMYQFMFLQLGNRSELKFDMTNGSKLDDYSYLVVPNQHTTVPAGSFQTLYLASPKRASGGRTEIWLAGKIGNLACKMVITEGDGSKLTQNLTSIKLEP